MALLGPNNALAWAHFRLRGGWRRSLLFTTGASVILGLLILGGLHLDMSGGKRTLASWSAGLLGFQAAILVLYVSVRISAAIRQDIQTKLIESHRLMPTPPLEAVAGYMTGAAMQPLVLCGAIFIIGIFTCAGAGLDLGHWAMVHIVLLGFAIFVWTLAAYASFLTKLGPVLFFIPMFFGPIMTEGGALAALPGVLVVLNPLIGNSIFDLRNTGIMLPSTYVLALAAQGYFATIFFIAAARNYRRADGVGIDTLLAMLHVAGWTDVSCVCQRLWEDFHLRTGRRVDEGEPSIQFIASILVGLLLSLVAVAAAAWAGRQWRRHKASASPLPARKPFPPLLLVAIATFMILLIPFAGPEKPLKIDILRTAAILAIALSAIYFLCAWVYFAYPKAGIAIFLWLLLAWGGPIVIDMIRWGLAGSGEVEQLTGIASCSPVGALIEIWDPTNHHTNPTPGIVMQLFIASIPLVLWLMIVPKYRRATRAAMTS